MKRNITYSFVAFLVVAAFVLSGTLTQMLMGVLKWEEMPSFLEMALFMSVIVAGLCLLVLTGITRVWESKKEAKSPYVMTRVGIVISIVLVVITSTYAAITSYLEGEKQLMARVREREAIENRRVARGRAVEAERQRIASLTPEQRAAEERQKQEKAAAAERAVAEAAARRAKVMAAKKMRDTQLQMAGVGALTLKRASKDPEAFVLRSLYVAPDGTACYEYRAKNSFGAILPGSAVLTTDHKLLVKESDGNAFVTTWNKSCTVPGGDEIAPLIERLGILD